MEPKSGRVCPFPKTILQSAFSHCPHAPLKALQRIGNPVHPGNPVKTSSPRPRAPSARSGPCHRQALRGRSGHRTGACRNGPARCRPDFTEREVVLLAFACNRFRILLSRARVSFAAQADAAFPKYPATMKTALCARAFLALPATSAHNRPFCSPMPKINKP